MVPNDKVGVNWAVRPIGAKKNGTQRKRGKTGGTSGKVKGVKGVRGGPQHIWGLVIILSGEQREEGVGGDLDGKEGV